MPKKPRATCANCPYYYFDGGGSGYGECRQCAPTAKRQSVKPNYWCGDHPNFDATRKPDVVQSIVSLMPA